MKKGLMIFGIISVLVMIVVTVFHFRGGETAAQVANGSDRSELAMRDSKISDEKVERAAREARLLMDGVKKTVRERYPKLKLDSETFSDPASAGEGRKGQSGFYLSWRRKDALYSIYVVFLFTPDEAAQRLRHGTDRISIGEFFPGPEFAGENSILVKNVQFNKSITNVGLHFVKGRLKISTILRNHKRTSDQNERDLLEFIKSIEPHLNAKLTFEEI